MTPKQRDRLLAKGAEICETCEYADAATLAQYDAPRQWEIDDNDGSECVICRTSY